MEPHNDNQETRSPEPSSEQTPVYHTISGGPETLEEVREREVRERESLMVPSVTISNTVLTNSVKDSLPVTLQQFVPNQGNFFDRHPTAAVVLFLGCGATFSPLLGLFLSLFFWTLLQGEYINPISIFLRIGSVLLPFVTVVVTIILGLVNFRGKRKEIFAGIGYSIVISLLVGLGMCLSYAL